MAATQIKLKLAKGKGINIDLEISKAIQTFLKTLFKHENLTKPFQHFRLKSKV